MFVRTIGMAALLLAAGLMVAPAFAQTSDAPAEAPKPAKPAQPAAKSPGGYYIEFRAARIGIYGHSYVAYGRLDRFGNPDTSNYADRHPMGNYAIMALGHFVPVPANTEWDPEVLDLPIAHKYRVKLNDTQYNNLLAALKRVNANRAYWNAVTNNCNHYVGQLAEAIGLRVPAQFHMSIGFIPDLQEMNEAAAPAMADSERPPKPTPKRKPAPKPAEAAAAPTVATTTAR